MRWTTHHREREETDGDHFMPQFWLDIRRTRACCNVIES
jgi:hypothetical protein